MGAPILAMMAMPSGWLFELPVLIKDARFERSRSALRRIARFRAPMCVSTWPMRSAALQSQTLLAMMDHTCVGWCNSLFTFFFVIGGSLASWVTRTPALRDQLGASVAQMGVILFGLSLGAMTGLLCATTLVDRLGTRFVAVCGVLFVCAGVIFVGVGALYAVSAAVFSGLLLFGLGMGSAEIALNMDGAALEKLTGKPVLSALHGWFSLGTFCGALLGIAFNALGFSVHWHLLGIVFVAFIAVARAAPNMPGIRASTLADPQLLQGTPPLAKERLWKDRKLLMISLIILAMAFAEGSANDWLPLLMVDEHGFSAITGSLVYAIFALGMTAGRFSGNHVLRWMARESVVRYSAVACAIGISMAMFSHNSLLAGLSVMFWGLGASLGFPLSISAAGDSGVDSTRRVGFVATAGYIAFLVGPPLLGFLGASFGLRGALGVVLVFAVMAIFLSGAVKPVSSSH
jgi:fucose permease